MSYAVRFLRSAERELAKLDRPIQRQIARKIDSLAVAPRPAGARKLRGGEDIWRVRAGSYRILYRIVDDVLEVLVVKIAHRRDVYRHRP